MKKTALTVEVQNVKYRAFIHSGFECQGCAFKENFDHCRRVPCMADDFLNASRPVIYKREAL